MNTLVVAKTELAVFRKWRLWKSTVPSQNYFSQSWFFKTLDSRKKIRVLKRCSKSITRCRKLFCPTSFQRQPAHLIICSQAFDLNKSLVGQSGEGAKHASSSKVFIRISYSGSKEIFVTLELSWKERGALGAQSSTFSRASKVERRGIQFEILEKSAGVIQPPFGPPPPRPSSLYSPWA